MGKEVKQVFCPPSLASADAVSQAQRQRQKVSLEAGVSKQEAAQTMSTPPDTPAPITAQQREMIRDLSSKLGEPDPQAMDDWTFAEAETYIEALRMQMEDLLSVADDALTSGSEVLPSQKEALASYAEIGDLKRAWMQALHIQSASSGIRQQWETFKQQHCKEPVNDDTMLQSQYLVLKNAIEQLSMEETHSPSWTNGHSARR
jgi:hypothetical protein